MSEGGGHGEDGAYCRDYLGSAVSLECPTDDSATPPMGPLTFQEASAEPFPGVQVTLRFALEDPDDPGKKLLSLSTLCL